MNNEYKDKLIGAILGTVLIFAGISVISIFLGNILKYIGFYYETTSSLILFFVISGIISFPGEIVVRAFLKALIFNNKISYKTGEFISIIIDICISIFIFSVVDYYMDSIYASKISIIILSILLSFTSKIEIKNFKN